MSTPKKSARKRSSPAKTKNEPSWAFFDELLEATASGRAAEIELASGRVISNATVRACRTAGGTKAPRDAVSLAYAGDDGEERISMVPLSAIVTVTLVATAARPRP